MAVDQNDDWHLKDWMVHFKKRQSSLINELGWDKAKANFYFHSKRPYRREVVNEISRWLGIRPYELLMPPAEALALRRLRESAVVIAAEAGVSFERDVEIGPPKLAAGRR